MERADQVSERWDSLKTREELNAYRREWTRKNKDVVAAYRLAGKERARQWKKENREKLLTYQREYRAQHRDRIIALDKAWKEKNPEHWRALRRRHYENNRFVHYARSGAYRGHRAKAQPKWANTFFIAEIYHLASLRTKHLGIKHHVDHIVPLRSKLVCGLHCESNLRVIPAIENNKKSNKTWPDKPA